MKNKLKLATVASFVAVISASASININWTVSFGVYPNDAPDLSSFDAGTGVAANNDVLWQLIWAPNNMAFIPDPDNSGNGYVGGDNVVLATRTIPAGGDAGFDEWLFNLGGATPYVDNAPGAVGSSVFQRVYEFDSAVPNSWYYDSDLTTIIDTDAMNPPQQVRIGDPADTAGVALNQQVIPEPGTMALLGLGMLGLVLRRNRMG